MEKMKEITIEELSAMPKESFVLIDIRDALEKVGLLDRKDYYPSKLSGGQQQRVANRVILVEDGLVVEENDADSFFLHPQQARTIEFLRKTKWKPEGEMLNDEGVI